MFSFAILIISHNRPDSLRALIDICLQLNVRTYISVDGARDPRDVEDNKRCKEIVGEYESQLFKIRRFEENLGLKNHVISSITWAFNDVDSLVILEEDLEIEETGIFFLGTCAEDLSNWSRIAAICGTRIIPANSQIEKISYQRSFASWGWSTNKIVWKDFLSYLTRSTLKDSCLTFINVLRFRSPIQTLITFRRESHFKIDSWSTCFQKFIFAKNLLIALAPRNLVVNKGWDERATHTTSLPLTWVPQKIENIKNYTIVNINRREIANSDKLEKILRKSKFHNGELNSPDKNYWQVKR